MDYKFVAIILGAVAIAIAALMEFLKARAKARRNKLATWVMIVIPAVLSALLAWVAWAGFGLPGEPPAMIAYALIIFVVQYFISIEILKRVCKGLVKQYLKKQGMTDGEIKEALGG